METIVLIPSHNEDASIGATLRSVFGQTHVPDRVIVVADNCTDRTAEVAGSLGAEVFVTQNNRHRKAGALNQVLDHVLPGLSPQDLVLCMDADTKLDEPFLENAMRHFDEIPNLGGLSSNHSLTCHQSLLGLLQSMEYERDRRNIGRSKGRKGCMSGMASMFRVGALRDVHQKHGSVYDVVNETEDWKLTFALKHLGYRLLKPQDCMAVTIPVTRWRDLFRQRERWGRGHFQTICSFGITRYTALSWLGQAWWTVNVLLPLLLVTLIAHSGYSGLPSWVLVIFGVFVADRINTARRVGWRGVFVALLALPDIIFAWWITAATMKGIIKNVLGLPGQWESVRT